jgi:hypothetical protein
MTYIIKSLRSILGLDVLQEEIEKLKIENESLKSTLKEHEQGIAYVAVLQTRMLKDVLYLVQVINSSTKQKSFVGTKKANDDLIN